VVKASSSRHRENGRAPKKVEVRLFVKDDWKKVADEVKGGLHDPKSKTKKTGVGELRRISER